MASDRRLSRRRFLGAGGALLLRWGPAAADEGRFLAAEEAPHRLFPEASVVTERAVEATPALRARVRALLGRPPTLWEPGYRIFRAARGAEILGRVVIVEEIGKHRPITFAVGVDPTGAVRDLVVLAYREAYGGEIRERRFLAQYAGRTLAAPLQPFQDVQNIAGATLSVQATGRAVKKAIAVLRALGELE